MKLLTTFFLLLCSSFFISCKKNKPIETEKIIDLKKKTLNEIRAAIAGTWEIKKYSLDGLIAVYDQPYPPGDFISFLTNDTVKRITNGNLVIYEKAQIAKEYSYVLRDSVFSYRMNSLLGVWEMSQIKNDTLVMLDGVYTYKLLK